MKRDDKKDQNHQRRKKTDGDKTKKQKSRTTLTFLHILQHICVVGAAVLSAGLILGCVVMTEGRSESERYYFRTSDTDASYEDTSVFNDMLGKRLSDLICYGAIRTQMESGDSFDANKEVDVTAYANRYYTMQDSYITAKYALDDLVKWAQYGFDTEEVYMTGEEADAFLSRSKEVTQVDLSGNDSASYLNSDLEKKTTVVDVSGNATSEDGTSIRDDVSATILKNRYHTVDGKNIENYVSSWDEYYALVNNVESAANDLMTNYNAYVECQDYYDGGNSNLLYFIRKTINGKTTVYTNSTLSSTKLSDMEDVLKDRCIRYIVYDPKNMNYDTNTDIYESTVRYVLNGYSYAYPEDTQILVGVLADYPASDSFLDAKNTFNHYSPNLWDMVISVSILAVLYLVLLITISFAEGRATIDEKGEKYHSLSWQDRIPAEVMLLMLIVLAGVFYLAANSIWNLGGDLLHIVDGELLCLIAGCYALLASVCFHFFYYSFIRRCKASVLLKNTLISKGISSAVKGSRYLYAHGSVSLRVFVPAGLLLILHIVTISLAHAGGSVFTGLLIFTILIDIAVMILLFKNAVGRERILQGLQKINAGDTDYQIDANGLVGDNQVLAKEVNQIGDGIHEAVEKSMKDERMKADLITNVSHDIKTPLTSIINYVDLIKREKIDNEKVNAYIAVLDEKSQRLKQLTDDLVEASKITSGNIVLHYERIRVSELLTQTIGEFSEKFEQKSLSVVLRPERTELAIEADPRRIWRVIENLFNNIYKYAMPGTRVYVDITEVQTNQQNPETVLNENGTDAHRKEKRTVQISIRNISENPIKVNAQDLTERFIRGDESRTTEGSGLGLSIAKNLTIAMHGSFDVQVDGDLFKVVLTFPIV